MFTRYPPFWPALQHNLIWLLVFLFIATPIGIFFAVLLDKKIRGTRVYQSAIYLPVVLSLAIVGFIWQLQYAPEQGFLNSVLGTLLPGHERRSTGSVTRTSTSSAVLVAASWRHIGYMMVLYLAGLKSVDPTLREAAAIDGAIGTPDVLPCRLPGHAADQRRDPRHHRHRIAARVRHRLHHQQGPERPRAAVRADHPEHRRRGSRVGFGSALAVVLLVISVGPIIVFLTRTFEEPE